MASFLPAFGSSFATGVAKFASFPVPGAGIVAPSGGATGLKKYGDALFKSTIGKIPIPGSGVDLGDLSLDDAFTDTWNATPQSGGVLTKIFLRGTIIILGFIFIAVGLTMFKTPIYTRRK